MLIAQAKVEDLTLVTTDSDIPIRLGAPSGALLTRCRQRIGFSEYTAPWTFRAGKPLQRS